MAFLEKFSDDEKELIVSLPYRAGLWVSQVDSTGDAEGADDKEAQTLEQIIREQSKGMFNSAFVHEVMVETFTRKQDWPKWQGQTDNIPALCKDAVKLIESKLDDGSAVAYRESVMAIAVNVAEAFREFDADMPVFARMMSQVGLLAEAAGRILTRKKSFKTETYFNISYEEDKALSQLYSAMQK